MTAYDAKTGKLLWGHSLDFEVKAPLVARKHVLIAAGREGGLVALDCTKIQPSRIWKRETGAPIAGAASLAGDLVLVGGDDWMLRAFDLKTGSPVWTYRAEGPIRGTPSIRDDVVYAGDDGGVLHAVMLSDGKAKWTSQVGGRIRCAPAVEGEIVVTTEPSDHPASVVRMDLEGRIVRRWTVAEKTISSPSVADGVVYYSAGSTLYADERPLLSAGDTIKSTPVLSGPRVYVGSDDHRMICADRATGEIQYEVKAEWYVPAAPALRGGRAYFADNQRRLYCVEDLGGDEWPQFGGGPERGGYNRKGD